MHVRERRRPLQLLQAEVDAVLDLQFLRPCDHRTQSAAAFAAHVLVSVLVDEQRFELVALVRGELELQDKFEHVRRDTRRDALQLQLVLQGPEVEVLVVLE